MAETNSSSNQIPEQRTTYSDMMTPFGSMTAEDHCRAWMIVMVTSGVDYERCKQKLNIPLRIIQGTALAKRRGYAWLPFNFEFPWNLRFPARST